MSEHHTQGRQGQGARRRRYHSNRNYRHRMPRHEEPKPSLLKRVLSFFGFGKKKDAGRKKPATHEKRQAPPQRVRVAQGRANRGGNPAAVGKSRRRPASVAPTEQARLYVGNLSFDATEAELEDLFKGFGNVRSVEIIYNSRTYRSKGYAFVEMMQLADAQRAAEVLHGQPFMGRELMVSAANERNERSEEPAAEASAPADQEEVSVDKVAFEEEVVVPLSPESVGSEQPATEEAAQSPAVDASASEQEA